MPLGTIEIVIREVLWTTLGSYSTIWSLPLTNVKWHSDPRPVKMTFISIRHFTKVMTSIPSLTFTKLREVSIEHLQRVLHASRERLPFWTSGFIPFGTCLCSNVETSVTELAVPFLDFLILNIPRYFLDFPLKQKCLHFFSYFVDMFYGSAPFYGSHFLPYLWQFTPST